MKKYKILILGLSFLMIIGVFTGCSSDDPLVDKVEEERSYLNGEINTSIDFINALANSEISNINLTDDITLNSGNIQTINRDLTIDLRGNTLTQNDDIEVTAGNTLIITSVKDGAKLKGDGGITGDGEVVNEVELEPVKAWTFSNHTSIVYDVAVDSDGNVYSGSQDNTVRKIDSGGNQVWSKDINSTVWEVAVGSSGNFVYSGDSDSNVKKLDNNNSGAEEWTFTQHSYSVYGLVIDNNDFLYSAGSWDNTVRKIDSGGNQMWSKDIKSTVYDVAVGSNGDFIYSGDGDGNVKKLNSNNSGDEEWTINVGGSVNSVTVDSEGNVYSGSRDNTVKKIDSEGNQVWSFDGHTDPVEDVVVDSNGNVYSGSSDNTVKKIDSEGNQVWSFNLPDTVYDVAIDSEGNVYTANYGDNSVTKIKQE